MRKHLNNIKNMEGAEAVAIFLGGFVKYSFMMLFVVFSSVLFLVKRFSKKEKQNE